MPPKDVVYIRLSFFTRPPNLLGQDAQGRDFGIPGEFAEQTIDGWHYLGTTTESCASF